MYLERISITNFRNLTRAVEIKLPASGLLVAAAPNASGKTNFLESIAVLLRGKSWRSKISECVQWENDAFLLEGYIKKNDDETDRIAIRYHKPTKKIRIEEGGSPASVISFYTQYPFVGFVAEDSFLFSRGPEQRRNFLNYALVSNKQYLSSLVQYHRVLKQRNIALKEARNFSDIEAWTDLLNDHAAIIWKFREDFTLFLMSNIKNTYELISGEVKYFNLSLIRNIEENKNLIHELQRKFLDEKKYKHTTLGPHRDDLVILTEGHNVATALSRGQSRSLVLALKILTLRYISKLTTEKPILLLDDVLNELDINRQTAFLNNLPKTQTIITCTTLPGSLREREDVFLLDLRSIVNTDKSPAGFTKKQVSNKSIEIRPDKKIGFVENITEKKIERSPAY